MPSFDEELPMTLSWPSDTLPGLSTGVVNHVDKDSRPDLLKGINVKVEPGGGGHRWEESLKSACGAHRGTDDVTRPGLDSVTVADTWL